MLIYGLQDSSKLISQEKFFFEKINFFSDFRLINTEALRENKTIFELIDFNWNMSEHIKRGKEMLITNYYRTAVDIFVGGMAKKKIPLTPVKLKKFFACVAVIMTQNMQNLCLNSLADFYNYITDTKVTSLSNHQSLFDLFFHERFFCHRKIAGFF